MNNNSNYTLIKIGIWEEFNEYWFKYIYENKLNDFLKYTLL